MVEMTTCLRALIGNRLIMGKVSQVDAVNGVLVVTDLQYAEGDSSPSLLDMFFATYETYTPPRDGE